MNAPTEPAPPRKRARWGRRLLILAVLLLVLIGLLPTLAGLPVIRDRIAALASDAAGRPVAIQHLAASWTKGIEISGIRVDSPTGFEEPLATIKRLHVKVDLATLLRGRLDASVVVESPWVTFLQDDQGRSNAGAFFRDRERDKAESASSTPRLRLQIRDGVVRARRPQDTAPQEVKDIQAELSLDPDGTTHLTFNAVASRAAPGEQDAAITVDALLPSKGEGDVRIVVPEIDLARVAQVIECASGVCDMRGRLAVTLEGKATPGPTFSGELSAKAEELGLRLPSGDRFAAESVTIVGKLLPGAATTMGDVLVRARKVVLGKGTLSLHGYVEPEIVVHIEAERPTADSAGAMVVRLKQATSRLLRVDAVSGAAPLTLTHAPSAEQGGSSRSRIEGAARATLDLDALARAFGGLLGLERTDKMSGLLRAEARVDLGPEGGHVQMSLLGAPLTPPASWGRGLPTTRIEGGARAELDLDKLVITVPRITGLGLDVNAHAILARHGDSLDAQEARIEVKGDLARARPLLVPLLDLTGRAALEGKLHAITDLQPEDGGLRIRGTSTLTQFVWRDETGEVRVREDKVTLAHDARLAKEEGQPHKLSSAEIVLPGVRAAVSGSLRTRGEVHDIDARLVVSGDAARLAPTLVRYLGKEYADLTGRGALAGELAVAGRTGHSFRMLRASGQIDAGGWSTGGLQLADARLELERKTPADPQRVVFTSQVNGGTLRLDATLRPGPERTPWQATLNAKGIDTSELVVSQGLGRYLAYLFPTIVPVDASTNVLSGKLDADVQLAATALEGEHLQPSLSGQGRLAMAQGRIGESTLFQVAQKGGGLGKVGQVIAATVPEIGRELEGLSRALTFHTMESRFDIAREILTIRHGLLEGERVNISFPGRVAFDKRMDLKLLVTLGGRAGERLARIIPSKTIPITVRGTLSEPILTPDLKVSDLQGGALKELIPGVGGKGNPVDTLRGLLGR